MRSRHLALAVALAATIAASIWAGSIPSPDVVAAAPGHAGAPLAALGAAPAAGLPEPAADGAGRTAAGAAAGGARAAAPAPAPPDLDLGQRPAPAAHPRDLFAAYGWTPPPVARSAAPALAPEPPQAPAPTFTYIGRLMAGDRESFLFLDGGRTQIVAIGGLIGDFRLDATSTNSLTFTHLPTGLPVTVPAPAAGEH